MKVQIYSFCPEENLFLSEITSFLSSDIFSRFESMVYFKPLISALSLKRSNRAMTYATRRPVKKLISNIMPVGSSGVLYVFIKRFKLILFFARRKAPLSQMKIPMIIKMTIKIANLIVFIYDTFVKGQKFRRQSKKLIMQGARILRNEAYLLVRCNDER